MWVYIQCKWWFFLSLSCSHIFPFIFQPSISYPINACEVISITRRKMSDHVNNTKREEKLSTLDGHFSLSLYHTHSNKKQSPLQINHTRRIAASRLGPLQMSCLPLGWCTAQKCLMKATTNIPQLQAFDAGVLLVKCLTYMIPSLLGHIGDETVYFASGNVSVGRRGTSEPKQISCVRWVFALLKQYRLKKKSNKNHCSRGPACVQRFRDYKRSSLTTIQYLVEIMGSCVGYSAKMPENSVQQDLCRLVSSTQP